MHSNIEKFIQNNDLDIDEQLAVLDYIDKELGLGRIITISLDNFEFVSNFLNKKALRENSKIDLIYCHLSGSAGLNDGHVDRLLKLLSNKGILCLAGHRTPEVSVCFGNKLHQVLATDSFSIFARDCGARAISSLSSQLDLFRRKYFFEKVRRSRHTTENNPPSVAIVVLTYNHEKYIAACLESVFKQQGNFLARVIIIDDASSDQTAKIIETVLSERHPEHYKVEFHANSHNVGVVKNLAAATRLAVGSDYLTFCEGDDYWSAESRIQEHLNFLAEHPECVMSFNTVEFCSADGSSRQIYEEQKAQPKDILDGNALAAFNIIGNFSACFYDGALLKIIPDRLFSMYTVDWMFNLYCAQFGGIGHLRKVLSVYRQHSGGEWSNRQEWDKASTLNRLCDEYNAFLDFQFNSGLQTYKKNLLGWMYHAYPGKVEKFDLIIVDDVFPAPCSGFRYAEFTAYLRAFPNSMALVSGATLPFLGEEPLDVLLHKYQLRYPELGNQIMDSAGFFPIRSCKLLYVNFLVNAYALLPLAEEARVPFAFTLYPGGGFGLNNPECDSKLRRVFASPSFRRVIVTQQVTYDYLVNSGLCPADKISLIFGVVMPQEAFQEPIPQDKLRWGHGKDRLDICFMAHRYTPRGEDKGYDVFVNAASQLCNLHPDIDFHVVGPFDRHVVNVGAVGNRIKYHGVLNPEQLDEFFRGMDIIVSPNISNKIWPGSFDGFPTASCTEGGLRGVAIFCTDEFDSAKGRFVDGRDFVLINYDLEHIVRTISYYHGKPDELKAIGEGGSRRILDLYGEQTQIEPRIRILRELIESPFEFDAHRLQSLAPCTSASAANLLNVRDLPPPSPLWACLKKYSPQPLKMLYRKYIKKHVGPRYGY